MAVWQNPDRLDWVRAELADGRASKRYFANEDVLLDAVRRYRARPEVVLITVNRGGHTRSYLRPEVNR